MDIKVLIALHTHTGFDIATKSHSGRPELNGNWGGVVRIAMPSGQAIRDCLSRFGESWQYMTVEHSRHSRTWRILAHMNGWVMSHCFEMFSGHPACWEESAFATVSRHQCQEASTSEMLATSVLLPVILIILAQKHPIVFWLEKCAPYSKLEDGL